MIADILQWLIDIFSNILGFIADALPSSPFTYVSAVVLDNELLSFIAWLVPFPQIISLLEVWLVAVGLFYLYSVVMRWVKLL